MATRNVDLTAAIFTMGKTVDVLTGSPKTGKRATNESAKAEIIRDKFKERGNATLNSAAFLIKAVVKGELRLAVAPADSSIYGEFVHMNKLKGVYDKYNFVTRLNSAGGAPEIYYTESAPEEGSPYEVLPYVAARVLLSDDSEIQRELLNSFINAVLKVKADPQPLDATDAVIKFCDSFYYHMKHIFKTDYFTVLENSLALETVKTSKLMGNLFDLSNITGHDIEGAAYRILSAGIDFEPCEALAGVKSPEGTEEKKKRSKKKPEATKWKSMLKDIKAGKYMISYEWSPEQLTHVPPMSYLDTFIPSEEFYEILRKIEYRIGDHMVHAMDFGAVTPDDIKNDIVNILLYGDPGSGKTAMVHALAAATGMPLYSIKFNEDSEDDVFEGKNKIVEGKISFVGTDFLEGFEKGGIILMEEINLGRANMLTSVMNQAMEYPFYVEKNGYEKVTRHPMVVAFATMNLDTDGTTTLNSAMAQRFNNKYMVGEPSAKEFKERLTASGFSEERVEHVYGVYSKIRDYLKENSQRQKFLKELSIRQCIAALKDMEEGTECRRAVFNTMYGAICIKNRKLADQIRETILDTYPDYMGE